MYEAPLLSIGLLLLVAYRYLTQFIDGWAFWGDAERKSGASSSSIVAVEDGPALPLLLPLLPGKRWVQRIRWKELLRMSLHYYTPLYIVFTIVVLEQLSLTYNLLVETDWLDPDKLRDAFKGEAILPTWWENELEHMLDEGSGWLRWFSITSPVFMVLTLAVSVANTHRHVQAARMKGGGMEANDGHDSAILIIALPLVYCTLAAKSVTRMLMVCGNIKSPDLEHIVDFDGHETWEARLVMAQLLYKTNLSVADLYEAWALFQFAWLTLAVIRTESQRLFAKISDQRILSAASREQDSLEQLTVQGIYLFILGCLLESIYYLVTTTVEVVGQQHARNFAVQVHSMKEQVHFFFLGMGTIASSAAIGNVVTVELAYHELLVAFRPAAKFWSTKVLVSIAFLQSLALYVPPLNGLSVTEQLLFYASALCLECFLVSLLHWIAWAPEEPWYDSLKSNQQQRKSEVHKQK